MQFIKTILGILDTRWETPTLFGWYHIACLIAMVAVSILLCVLWKKGKIKNPQRVILVTAIIVLIFEIYKQINFTFGDGTTAPDYKWYAFPWQFCSTPLYIGLLAGLCKGKMRDNFDAYLATYALFAGLAVMIYPGDVFTSTLGICVQTMICHGSMVVIAVFLYYSGYVKAELKTLWKALPVFVVTFGLAITLNELFYYVISPALNLDDTFNMFYVSSHFDSTLPVYSLIHNALMAKNPAFYPICLAIYVFGFTLVAFIMLSVPMAIKKFNETDFDARYVELDKRLAEEARIKAEKKAALEARIEAELLAKEEEKRQKKEAKLAKKKAKEEAKLEKKKKKESERQREKREEKEERKKRKEKKREERKEKREKKKKERKEKRAKKKKERKEKRKKEREERKRIKKEKNKAKKRAMKEKRKQERKEKRKQKKQERKEKRQAKREERTKAARERRRLERLEKERLEEQRRKEKKEREAQEKRMLEKGITGNPALEHFYNAELPTDIPAPVIEAPTLVEEKPALPVCDELDMIFDTDLDGYRVSSLGKCDHEVIVIPSEYKGKPVVSIDARAFDFGFNLKSVIVPEGVKRIGMWAFNCCTSLESVSLPESLEVIESGAFEKCYDLKTIKYAGTKMEWKALSKQEGWNENTGMYIIDCYNGEIIK